METETLPAWLAREASGQLGLTEFSFIGREDKAGVKVEWWEGLRYESRRWA